jgi:hypothetical protein
MADGTEQPAASLEERVAALEAAIALFTRKLFERGDITINDARAAMGLPGLGEVGAVRRMLRECVTVVKPGETLIVRGTNWTPNQTREVQQVMDGMHELGIVPFKALAVFGDELGVAEAQP